MPETALRPRRRISASARDPEWQTHTQFEIKYPAKARMELAYEAHYRAKHAAANDGDPEGYEPSRTYPCPGMLRFWDRTGALWIAGCDVCGYEVSILRTEIDRDHLIGERLRLAAFPAEFRDKPFRDEDAGQTGARRTMRLWLEHYGTEDQPKAPLPVGPSGRGKTHLLIATAESLIRRTVVQVFYATLGDLLADSKLAFDKGPSRGLFDRACGCAVLVLDDLGAERMTDFALDQLRVLVELRYREARPMLCATNVAQPEWSASFGERTASRLAGMCEAVEMGGRDWRTSP